jgi:hypothetical protein
MDTDGQSNTRDDSSLPEISYFTGELQYVIVYNIILCLGKTSNSQDRLPAIQQDLSALMAYQIEQNTDFVLCPLHGF